MKRLVVGICPAIAVATSAVAGLAMGLIATGVLTVSTLIVSMTGRCIPKDSQRPCQIIIIGTFVALADLILTGLYPDLRKALGFYLPLLTVSCLVLGSAALFDGKKQICRSTAIALLYGMVFTISVTLIGCIRSSVGHQTPVALSSAGGGLIFGLALGAINLLVRRDSSERTSAHLSRLDYRG